jgi:hypothetical protein
LDTFALEIDEKDEIVVDTGKKILGPPAAESPAKAVIS